MLLAKPKLDNHKINLKRVYSQIKTRCLLQNIFSTYLLCGFFILQYSVPICLVVLGSVTTSREQLDSFFYNIEIPKPGQKDAVNYLNETQKKTEILLAQKASEILVSRIIFILGIITILLGVINNIIRPAESYDKAVEYNNKFIKFSLDLDLAIIENGGIPQSSEAKNFNCIVKLLFEKNQELARLINEYNQVRSLNMQSPEIEVLKQEIDELRTEIKNN